MMVWFYLWGSYVEMALIEPKYFDFIEIILDSWLQRMNFYHAFWVYNSKVGILNSDIWLYEHQRLNKLVEIKILIHTLKNEELSWSQLYQ